ncbi:BatA domain-containing protein [Granulosicoccus sp.]|nr:BatA domain-containing protein [Granulosicoccus sp.]MDB4223287.1 BatA domain-containing protein [Granulosicoccus sp.]
MSLLFPAYLLGLLGLLLPWVLHRFSDQKPEEQLFPSAKFLEKTKPPVSRTRTLKYRVLMAIRMLSVLLLCFLFAQPWLNNANDSGDAKMHHIIAVDLSLSMQAGNSWDSALEKGRDLIDQYGENASVELVGFDQAFFRIADNKKSKADLVQGLATMQPGYVAADYGVLMQRLNRLAVERSETVKIWIITDQQRSALPAQRNTLYAPDVAEFEFLSTVSESQRNVHVNAFAHSDDGVNIRVTVQLTASVSEAINNASANTVNDLIQSTVTIRSNEKVLAQRVVGIAASGLEAVVFDSLIMPPGDAPVLTISIEESDALLVDNSQSIVINQANPTQVASLQHDNSTSRDAFVFIATALETDSQASVVTISGTAERIAPAVLHLVSGRDLSQNLLDLDIRQFVDQGKNALVFSNNAESTSEALLIRGDEVGLVDESHPMALGDIDWFGTEFYDVPRITLKEDDRVLLETTQRQAILVERQTAKGRILLLNDRLDGQSSNLPFQPAFVTLVKSIVDYFDASTALPDLLTTGERLIVSGNVQLLDPDNNSLLSFDERERQGGIVLNQPGLYKVIGQRGSHIVNVQLDKNEADLTLAADDSIVNWRKRFDGNSEVASNDPTQESSASETLLKDTQAQRSRSRFWLWLLPILAAALFIETLLANRRLDVRRDGS